MATGSGAPSWSGNITPTQQRTAQIKYPGTTRIYGQATVEPGGDPGHTKVRVSFTTPVVNQTYQWGLHEGRCGTNAPAVVPINVFPAIDVSGNGSGQAAVEIPMSIPESGAYHVNLFVGGNGLEHVIACSNLKLSRR